MIFAGIDIGSNTTKAALLKNDVVIATQVLPSGYQHSEIAEKIYSDILDQTGYRADQVERVISTGYGRNSVPFAQKALTEIICHAAGAHFIHPGLRGIIDVGGQDSKAISLDEKGSIVNFAMNDKCAAGTGRFIEVMARTLGLPLEQMGKYHSKADQPLKISSICTVFAESEVISMISQQKSRENIIAGIHQSAASRIASLAAKVNLLEPVMMTGGVAKNSGMVSAIETALNKKLIITELSQETGAIGAAILAKREL